MSFDLPASTGESLLNISGFTAGVTAPVLYEYNKSKKVYRCSEWDDCLPVCLAKDGASSFALVGQATTSYNIIGATLLLLKPTLT